MRRFAILFAAAGILSATHAPKQRTLRYSSRGRPGVDRNLDKRRDGHGPYPLSLAHQIDKHPAAVALLDVLALEAPRARGDAGRSPKAPPESPGPAFLPWFRRTGLLGGPPPIRTANVRIPNTLHVRMVLWVQVNSPLDRFALRVKDCAGPVRSPRANRVMVILRPFHEIMFTG